MFKKLITSAANKITVTMPDGAVEEIVVADSCHFGRNMQDVFKVIRQLGGVISYDKSLEDRGQGFIDESGEFHTRAESYDIAKQSGQFFNNDFTLPGNKLDSSCIRHIPSEYCLDKIESACLNWLSNQWCLASEEQRKEFMTHDLFEYHHTLGRDMRNVMDLWNVELNDEHPDEFSMRMIYKFRESMRKLNESTN